MTTLSRTAVINFTEQRCYDCGRFWMLESAAHGTCPCCAKRSVDAAVEEQQRLERVISALRGALKRKAKAR